MEQRVRRAGYCAKRSAKGLFDPACCVQLYDIVRDEEGRINVGETEEGEPLDLDSSPSDLGLPRQLPAIELHLTDSSFTHHMRAARHV